MKTIQTSGIVQPERYLFSAESRLWEDLSRRQREYIREKVSALRDQGASGDEIHVTIAEFLRRSKQSLGMMLNPKPLHKSCGDCTSLQPKQAR